MSDPSADTKLRSVEVLILGGGLSGIACSYYTGHERCFVVERETYLGGHIHSHQENGFTWDEGPHVSFTTNEVARSEFASSCGSDILEYPVQATNYFHGRWIPHPAQSNLYAADATTREACLRDFLASRQEGEAVSSPAHYGQWTELAFGQTFAEQFSNAYTKKYWTTNPDNLTTDWVGSRVFYPKIDDFVGGCQGPLPIQTHYIKTVRYPARGGYSTFCDGISQGIRAVLKSEVCRIDLGAKIATLSTGESIVYDTLVNTIPLPTLVRLVGAPASIREHTERLSCSSVLLINVEAGHPTQRPENWIYVYDEDKWSTRINCTELLSPQNAPKGKSGIQVEVYFSKYRPYDPTLKQTIVAEVVAELIEMGLVRDEASVEGVHTNYVPWANVIFDRARRESLDAILDYLSAYGLRREDTDLDPMDDWTAPLARDTRFGSLILAGRFAQWKYYWTDDCLLRGRLIGQALDRRQVGTNETSQPIEHRA